MDKAECPLCCNAFDYDSHRPRSLPCGHGYCTQCIDTWIHQGDKSCPTCRTVHGFSSAMALPVNFLAEEMLKKTVISASHNHETESRHEEMNYMKDNASLQPVEAEINKKRGQIIVTAKNKAKALSYAEKDLEEILQNTIDHVTKQKNIKQELEKEVELLIHKSEQIHEDITEKEKSKEEIRKFLEGCQKNQISLATIVDNFRIVKTSQDIRKQCEIAAYQILKVSEWEWKLTRELNMHEINVTEANYQKMSEILNLKSNSMSEDPPELEAHGATALHPNVHRATAPKLDFHRATSPKMDFHRATASKLDVHGATTPNVDTYRATAPVMDIHFPTAPTADQIRPNQPLEKQFGRCLVYQPDAQSTPCKYLIVERNGVVRRSMVIMEGTRTIIPSLSREVKPTLSAILINEYELGLDSFTSGRGPVVFMDISWYGKRFAGRVFIRVLDNNLPEGQEFVKLALGLNGPSCKGATIGAKGYSGITLQEYVTETGARSSMPLLTYPTANFRTPYKGMVFSESADKASIVIMTNDDENQHYSGYFGDVISGLDVLDTALYRCKADSYADISIIDCGLVLNY